MHYRDLGISVALDQGLDYQRGPSEVDTEGRYETAMRSRSPEDIVDFLKEWNRRIKVDPKKLEEAIINSEPTLRKLRKHSVVSINLDARIEIDGETKSLHDVVVGLFDLFSKVSKTRKNYTGASKILHVLAPRFFVMWDDTIRCAYGCRIKTPEDAGKQYFRFLKRSQREAREAVGLYWYEHNCSIQEAIKRIREQVYQSGYHTMARLVDLYNFQKYTQGKDELW